MPQKENDKFAESKLKVMEYYVEYYDLADREFKITFMKKLNEIQENSEKQFNELKNKNNEQKECFTKRLKF